MGSSIEAQSVKSWAEARERGVELAEAHLGFPLNTEVTAKKLEQMQSVLSDIEAAGDRFGMEAAYFHSVAEAMQKARDEKQCIRAEMPVERSSLRCG